jgi:hypothetical protein
MSEAREKHPRQPGRKRSEVSMNVNDQQLDALFARYRDACPEVDASAEFMPVLWRRIEKRGSVSFLLPRLARLACAASAVICLVLAGLVSLPELSAQHPAASAATYADALSADHSAEKTYYTESIRATDNLVPADYRR